MTMSGGPGGADPRTMSGGPGGADPRTITGDGASIGAASAESVSEPLRYNESGLICAVAQQFDTREVLMVAWMDAEALRRTLETGAATYFSRSRQQYWIKGETSGNTQRVLEVRQDCDGDTVLLLVDQHGSACHTGTRSCFDGRPVGMRTANLPRSSDSPSRRVRSPTADAPVID